MGKTFVMTLRLAPEVAEGVERLARRFGHKPAQLGARLVEEGLRRRDHPHIDLRETSGGRVAYLAGTRFAVYWLAQSLRNGMTAEKFARQHDLPLERIQAALAYAAAYPEEIEDDILHAEANWKWLESQHIPSPKRRSSRKQGKRSRTLVEGL